MTDVTNPAGFGVVFAGLSEKTAVPAFRTFGAWRWGDADGGKNIASITATAECRTGPIPGDVTCVAVLAFAGWKVWTLREKKGEKDNKD